MKNENWNTRLAGLVEEKGVKLRDIIPLFRHHATPYKHLAGTRNMDLRSARIWAQALDMTVDELIRKLEPVDQVVNQ